MSDDREDVRYLGRLLGDAIRAAEGERVFEQIESIRQASVAVHREGGAEARERELAALLGSLSIDETLTFVRGFTLFSLLANLAAAPAIPPVTVLGTAAATLAPVWPFGARMLCLPCEIPLWWLRTVAEVVAGLPGSPHPAG